MVSIPRSAVLSSDCPPFLNTFSLAPLVLMLAKATDLSEVGRHLQAIAELSGGLRVLITSSSKQWAFCRRWCHRLHDRSLVAGQLWPPSCHPDNLSCLHHLGSPSSWISSRRDAPCWPLRQRHRSWHDRCCCARLPVRDLSGQGPRSHGGIPWLPRRYGIRKSRT